MSSVKDRIRNLQQSATSSEPSTSVAELTKAVERGSEPNAEQQKSLSQLKNKFDSNVATKAESGLVARVARFDSDTSETLQERVRRLESGAADTGNLAARASAFEREGGGVKDAAGQFTEQEATTNDTNDALRKARAMFEAGSTQNSAESKISTLTASSGHSDYSADTSDSSRVSPATSMKQKPTSPAIPSRQTTIDAVSSRAAMFERAESEPHPSEKSPAVTQRDPPKSLPSFSPIQRCEVSETSDVLTSKAPERTVKDQLRDLKETNEKLVSLLLGLTSAFKDLEGTRDDLQRRIGELEKK